MSAPTVPVWVEEVNNGGGSDSENNREWWRWHFAGLAMAALIGNLDSAAAELRVDSLADQAVTRADVLIQHLEARQ